MTNPDTLVVWYQTQRVGYLRRNATNQIGFDYDDGWRSRGFPISISLPLTHGPFSATEAIAHRFFANLLPEGDARARVVRQLKLADSDFDLLRAIGGECAGALSLLPDDKSPDARREYQALSDEELYVLVTSKGQIHSESVGQGGEVPRLSLAGAQDKYAVLIRDGIIHLPRGDAPSTHIIKFAVDRYRHIPAYEAVLTELARRVGLATNPIEYHRLPPPRDVHDYIIVQRYDRIVGDGGDIRRLHQEDLCQALGLGGERKYEADGGPNLATIYGLLQDVSSNPARDGQQLLVWQIFNLVAGNSDGHAKNLALLYHADGSIRLAPFYDLVCTRAVEHISTSLAFSIGGEQIPGNVRRQQWDQLAKDLGIRSKYLLELVHDVAARVRDAVRPTLDDFQVRHGPYPALQRVQQVVDDQCTQTLRQLA